MTEEETAKILAVVRARYPLSKLWEQDESLTLTSWEMTVSDVSYAEADAALARWFKTEPFAPDPAELRKRVLDARSASRREQATAETLAEYQIPALGDGWLRRAADPTADNLEVTNSVVEIADAWSRGEIGLDSVRRQCSGWERFVALNHAKDAIQPLVDALAQDDEDCGLFLRTKHGHYLPQDLAENGGLHGAINGRRVLRWPTSGNPDVGWRYDHDRGR
jgi:hypothetical protein